MKTQIALLCTALVAAPLHAGEAVTNTPPPKQPKVLAECGVAVVVIGVGVVVIWNLKKLCDKVLPPASTNAPAPPSNGNNDSVVVHVVIPATSSPVLSLADDAVSYSTITGMGFKDPSDYTYTTYFTGTLQSSTDLRKWTNCVTINGWASPATVVTVFSSGGVPLQTNWSNLNSQTISVNYSDAPAPMKFYRLTSP